MGRPDLEAMKQPIYTVENGAFVRHNGDRYCNRPLYCNQTNAVVLAGDKPYLMLGGGTVRSCVFMVGLKRAGKVHWAQLASDITMRFTPGQMEWVVRDPTLTNTTLILTAVPTETGVGMAMQAKLLDALPGDTIVWLSGAAVRERETVLNHYDLTTGGREDRLTRGFVPGDCNGNKIQVNKSKWTVASPAGKGATTAVGICSSEAVTRIIDADQWNNPDAPQAAGDIKLPICVGETTADLQAPIYWSIRNLINEAAAAAAGPKEDFDSGMSRAAKVRSQVVVDTPDEWLNAAVGASCHVMDGVYRDGFYTHAGMRWGVPLLGWRTTFGATAYGWHDRVLVQARRCIARQVTHSDKTEFVADPATLLSSQAPDSRLFGVGRIDLHQPNHYDMQSQFFDQLLYAWRATGDQELLAILRPSLDLHLAYIKDCFDPQNLGIFEGYANSWPTDDQWYNGGGTSEETAYAYRAHHDALAMAQLAHDDAIIKREQAALSHIHDGFFNLLWNAQQGHPGAYREQGGLKRLHDSAWLYGIFCPIDAGLLDSFQAAQALDYTEWGLERMKMPFGGEQCWPSNWVPSIWSVREMWPGDNYQLALAYYQTGLAEQGWELLRGTFPQEMFFGPVPGDLGHPAGGTDFNDCAGMFCRTVVEGLFGYVPDYPHHHVTISPGIPVQWGQASIHTPDVELNYAHQNHELHLDVKLNIPAELELQIPVSTRSVRSVKVDAQPAAFDLLPGFEKSVVSIKLSTRTSAKIDILTADDLPIAAAQQISLKTGEPAILSSAGGALSEFRDPQGILTTPRIQDGRLTGIVSSNAGDHMLFGLATVGETTQWQRFKVHITDVASEQAIEAKKVAKIPADASWSLIDMTSVQNGDVRAIYKQQYLSPRPKTASLRLATDGYSTWQMVLDPKNSPPTIDLSHVDPLLNKQGQLVSNEGAPFAWKTSDKNIAFVSQWDNWPRQIAVPIDKSGEAIWFLVCGTTNPMEVQIANASLVIEYADRNSETIELIPPFNFWSLAPIQKSDYDYKKDFFSLPKQPPSQVQLGNNCRAIVLNYRLRPGVKVNRVLLKALSEQTVIGLMGVSIMNPEK